MIKRLRMKFICINMAIVTAMLYVIFSLILFFMGLGMQIQSRSMMQSILESTIRTGVQEWERQEVRRAYFVVRQDAAGEISLVENTFFENADREQLLKLTGIALEDPENSGTLDDYALRFQKRLGRNGMIVVFLDMSAEMATMKNLVYTCAFIGIISFSVFLIISFLLAKWAVKPVEKAWNQQRQFVADASHELKTPLTVIMTNAELLQTPGYAERERMQFADSILIMSRQMRGLVESLLELARVDNGTAKMVFSQVDFSELTDEQVMLFEPVYFEKELRLESRVEGDIRIRGSRGHLVQVLEALLDNAAKYTGPGGWVRVELKRQASHCLLQVSNPGEAIGREDLKNIFKRFYRIDKARAMNHSYGLGLAIADSIIKEHGGKIWAESAQGINTFFVQLPIP